MNYQRTLPDIFIISLYVLISLIITFPLVFNFSQSIPSDSLIKEALNYPKYNWWIKKALFELRVNPFYCTWLSHPTGVSYFLDLFHLSIYWLFLPVWYFFSLTTTHNLIIIFALVLSAYGAYLLVKYFTQDKLASFLSGVIFGFSPYLLGVMLNGWMHVINAQWIPFYILYLFKTFKQGKRKNAVFAGLFLSLSFYCSFYYFIYLAVFSCIFFLYNFCFNVKKVINRQFAKNFLLLLVIFILSILPVIPLLYSSIKAGLPHFKNTPCFPDKWFLSADLFGFFWPFSKGRTMPFIQMTTYLGYLVLILSLLGLFFRKRQTYFWLWTGLIFFLLALGPYLKINDQFIFWGVKIPLPSLLLDKLVPFWKILRHHLRATCLVMLSLAVLSGYGLQRFLKNFTKVKKLGLTFLLAILILFEFLIISPIPYPIPLLDTTDVPSFYYELAKEEGDFAVFDWPIPPISSEEYELPINEAIKRGKNDLQLMITQFAYEKILPIRLYPYYQTVHNKKILISYSAKRGLEGARPPFFIYHPFSTLLSLLIEPSQTLNLASSDFHLLRLFDIKYIIVHNDLLKQAYGDSSVERINFVLERALGRPKYYPEDELCVYKLYDKENPKTKEDLVKMYSILGELYLEDKEYERARDAYQQALKINPTLGDIQAELRELSQ